MAYIVATLMRKAIEHKQQTGAVPTGDDAWKTLMLAPHDYDAGAIHNTLTRSLMAKVAFEHGGPEYDAKYPEGIPTSLAIDAASGDTHDSGLVMFPAGHAGNTTADLEGILDAKFSLMANLASDDPRDLLARYRRIADKSAQDLAAITDHPIATREFEDADA